MKKILVCSVAILLTAGAAISQTKAVAKTSTKTTTAIAAKTTLFKNLNDSFSYAAGMNIAESMQKQGITSLNSTLMQKAMQDVFNKKTLLLTNEQATACLQTQIQVFMKKKDDESRVKNNAYLSANKIRKGVTTLPDGLQYEVLLAGDAGIRPTAVDTVVVDYVGTLTDGSEFDNSVKRGDPATFPVGGVIKGWTEVLQLMTKGAKWRVVIPSELGYGERAMGAQIPANAVLVFEITLRDIKPVTKP